jgi:hypothetical protein
MKIQRVSHHSCRHISAALPENVKDAPEDKFRGTRKIP